MNKLMGISAKIRSNPTNPKEVSIARLLEAIFVVGVVIGKMDELGPGSIEDDNEELYLPRS